LLLEQPPGGLLDLGCGSGVIAIAAAALGFSPVLDLDLDPVAVEVAAANAAANGAAIETRQGDASAADLPRAPLAVANIALDVVAALGARLPTSRLISSGYRSSDRPELASLTVVRRELDGWAADLHLRR
jgi:ribosomal protein L11 methyltransferase